MSGLGFKQGCSARIPLLSIATIGLDIRLEDLEEALKLWRFEIRHTRLRCVEECHELAKKPGGLLLALL
jgi:hypothetical protein